MLFNTSLKNTQFNMHMYYNYILMLKNEMSWFWSFFQLNDSALLCSKTCWTLVTGLLSRRNCWFLQNWLSLLTSAVVGRTKDFAIKIITPWSKMLTGRLHMMLLKDENSSLYEWHFYTRIVHQLMTVMAFSYSISNP